MRVRVHACSVTQSHLTLCNSMDCIMPSSSVYGLLQARILGWFAISFSRGSSLLRDHTLVSYVSCIGRRILYHWATWEAHRRDFRDGKYVTCLLPALEPVAADVANRLGHALCPRQLRAGIQIEVYSSSYSLTTRWENWYPGRGRAHSRSPSWQGARSSSPDVRPGFLPP